MANVQKNLENHNKRYKKSLPDRPKRVFGAHQAGRHLSSLLENVRARNGRSWDLFVKWTQIMPAPWNEQTKPLRLTRQPKARTLHIGIVTHDAFLLNYLQDTILMTLAQHFDDLNITKIRFEKIKKTRSLSHHADNLEDEILPDPPQCLDAALARLEAQVRAKRL